MQAMAGLKTNRSSKPLKIGMMNEMDEETLNRENDNLNMTQSHYMRD